MTPCPACDALKASRLYLCRGCWFTLPAAARRALNRHDAKAGARLLELHDQLADDVPLHKIAITP